MPGTKSGASPVLQPSVDFSGYWQRHENEEAAN
jgi:hypothetical protein